MRRNEFKVRDELKEFFEDEEFMSPETLGNLAGRIFREIFDSMKAGKSNESIFKDTMGQFAKLIETYAAGERRRYWQEFKRLYDAGVIKKAAFISYIMEAQGFTHPEAVKYVAETFGMNPSTQSVYLSDEFKLREKEKAKKKK